MIILGRFRKNFAVILPLIYSHIFLPSVVTVIFNTIFPIQLSLIYDPSLDAHIMVPSVESVIM
jgi:hypothetical protein